MIEAGQPLMSVWSEDVGDRSRNNGQPTIRRPSPHLLLGSDVVGARIEPGRVIAASVDLAGDTVCRCSRHWIYMAGGADVTVVLQFRPPGIGVYGGIAEAPM